MTRLEKQIWEKEQELEKMKAFAREKQGLFLNDLPKIEKILWSYGIRVDSKDNSFIDETVVGEKKYIFRMYLKTLHTKTLSERQLKNLENKLRKEKIPMPICPISFNSINLVYHD